MQNLESVAQKMAELLHYDKEHNQGQIVVSHEIYAKSADMMGGGFFGGDKGEGSIQNVEN